MSKIKVTIGSITPENRDAVDAVLAAFGLGPTSGSSFVALIDLSEAEAETIGGFLQALSSLLELGATVSIDLVTSAPDVELQVLTDPPPPKGPRLRP